MDSGRPGRTCGRDGRGPFLTDLTLPTCSKRLSLPIGFTGGAGLKEVVTTTLEDRTAGRFAAQREAGTQFRHMVTNIAVTIDSDQATATAYLLVLISKEGDHRTLPPGRYECELVKQGDRWLFSRRTVFHDHEYTLNGIGNC